MGWARSRQERRHVGQGDGRACCRNAERDGEGVVMVSEVVSEPRVVTKLKCDCQYGDKGKSRQLLRFWLGGLVVLPP